MSSSSDIPTVSRSRASKKPSRYNNDEEELEYALVVFTLDSVKRVVLGSEVRQVEDKDGWEAYDKVNKKWYSAVVLERTCNKDKLNKKLALLGGMKRKKMAKTPQAAETNKDKKREENEERREAKERKREEMEERREAKERKREEMEERREAKERKKEEMEKMREEKEREKRILAKRDEHILESMTALCPEPMECDSDSDDCQTWNLPASFNQTTPQPFRRTNTPPASFTQTTPQSASRTNTPPASLTQTTPQSASRTQTTPQSASRTNTPPASHTQTKPHSSRRTNTPPQSASRTKSAPIIPACRNCQTLHQRLAEAEKELAELKQHHLVSIENEDRPRPGLMTPALAELHNMTEVSPGTGVYAFEHTLQEAATKKTGTGVALFLLSVFYPHSELLEAGTLLRLDAAVVTAIVAFAGRAKGAGSHTSAQLRQALRVKIEGIKYRAKKHLQK